MNYVLVQADKAANNVVVVERLYYINIHKRELVDTNEYKLQPSLSERVIFAGHGCHTALHFDAKLKKIKTKFLRCTGYLNSIKTLLVLVQQQNFLNCYPRVLQLLKTCYQVL